MAQDTNFLLVFHNQTKGLRNISVVTNLTLYDQFNCYITLIETGYSIDKYVHLIYCSVCILNCVLEGLHT